MEVKGKGAFPHLRLFRIKWEHEKQNINEIFVGAEKGIGVFGSQPESYSKLMAKELLEIVPDVLELWKAGTLGDHPRVEFLDESGPVVLAIHSTGGSFSECAEGDLWLEMENEQEAVLMEQKIEQTLDLPSETIIMIHQSEKGLTFDQVYDKVAEYCKEYGYNEDDDDGQD